MLPEANVLRLRGVSEMGESQKSPDLVAGRGDVQGDAEASRPGRLLWFQKKHCSTIQSLTVGGSLYEYNAQTLIPLARAATHVWRNLRKFVPFLGNISQPRQPSSAGRGDVSKGTLRPPAQAD